MENRKVSLDDTITLEAFEQILRDAGKLVSIGRYRPTQRSQESTP